VTDASRVHQLRFCSSNTGSRHEFIPRDFVILRFISALCCRAALHEQRYGVVAR
jgi:hypothetical protein